MRRAAFLIGFLIGASIVVIGSARAVSGWMSAQSAAVEARTTLPVAD